jgi:hypothetical protein
VSEQKIGGNRELDKNAIIYHCVPDHYLNGFHQYSMEKEMKKSVLFPVAGITLAMSVISASAHEAHEHGTARVNLTVEGSRVEIELETPLANLISFEHAPATEAQKKEVRDMAAALRDTGRLFIFPAAAQCRLEKISLESEVIGDTLLAPAGEPAVAAAKAKGAKAGAHADHEDHEDHADHEDHEEGEETHADLDVEMSFVCQNPGALKQIEIGMFKVFPNLHEIEVQMLTPKGQGAASLGKNSSVIKW